LVLRSVQTLLWFSTVTGVFCAFYWVRRFNSFLLIWGCLVKKIICHRKVYLFFLAFCLSSVEYLFLRLNQIQWLIFSIIYAIITFNITFLNFFNEKSSSWKYFCFSFGYFDTINLRISSPSSTTENSWERIINGLVALLLHITCFYIQFCKE
jgi:hypothetical protein